MILCLFVMFHRMPPRYIHYSTQPLVHCFPCFYPRTLFGVIASDGPWSLCVGCTDRGVAVYHWNEKVKQLDLVDKFSLTGQVSEFLQNFFFTGTKLGQGSRVSEYLCPPALVKCGHWCKFF